MLFTSTEGHLKAPMDAHLLWRNLNPSRPRLSIWPAPLTLLLHTQEADTPKCTATERQMVILMGTSWISDIGDMMTEKVHYIKSCPGIWILHKTQRQ